MPTATKRKAPVKLATPAVRSGVKVQNKTKIDESNATIVAAEAETAPAIETIEISSGEEYESSDDDIDMEQANGAAAAAAAGRRNSKALVNGKAAKGDDEDGSDGEATSPSFGELLRGSDAVDVTALLAQPITAAGVVARTSDKAINPVSHRSLTATLTQALKSDDTDLLESCLSTGDLPTIRNTIEEIDSTYAGILLTKLAARLYRRPGRAGNLMTWVQWTIIAHGGALASQPKVIQGLNGLQKVLAERAKGLNSLLALKGKLDLLQGQMDLRRKMQSGKGIADEDDLDEDVDEHVIWVEGDNNARAGGDDDDGAAPLANGYDAMSDDDEDDESVVEDDQESVEGDELDEHEVAYDEPEESNGEDEESDAEPAPPSKLQKVANYFKRK
ncbi:hypothetical protein VHEMI00824 [[Torrubiella] hemipterigena]|uniref:Small-subunit processome Utp12 domain-containing protein n=1 Tax=[Torrubiella] hemipterigena TaxID=1531966 RepID=A0A0A1SKE2_9HYPO|nr:hypothetical protein VHEMI00824 [[Torrubiella] hemipterigena]